jgi:TAG lipase/steryl ester hydrolase/phospholipase A2/LPA acyltransferase
MSATGAGAPRWGLAGLRAGAARRRALQEAEHALADAPSLPAWRQAAAAHDALTGADAWRAEDDHATYDARRLRADLRTLAALRQSGDALAVADHLHALLHRHQPDLADPSLFVVAWSGTKHLVDRFVAEVSAAVDWLADVEVRGLSDEGRLARLDRELRALGRPALLLSGGGTLGFIHLGVVKALVETGLLPEVLSGASMGAMIAAGVGARTDAELQALFADLSPLRLRGLAPARLPDALRRGAVLDPSVLDAVIRANCGELTFAEAHARTGRVVAISVSPTRRRQKPRLLSHVTAPDVLLASAALASSAIPGVFPPAQLRRRAPDGAELPYARDERWADGSFGSDLPKRRLARLHNVNHYVVSQTNPHVVPFLRDPRGAGPWRAAAGLAGKAVLHQSAHTLSLAAQLSADTPLRPLLQLGHGLLAQDYTGDIDLHPQLGPDAMLRALTNPSLSELERYVRLGERTTWPHLARVEVTTAASRAVTAARGRVAARLGRS